MLKATRAMAEGIERARTMNEAERAERDMMSGIIGGEEYRRRMRDFAEDEQARLRWVVCEACGGSGEIIRRDPNARDPSDEYAEICAACEGTGRDCE